MELKDASTKCGELLLKFKMSRDWNVSNNEIKEKPKRYTSSYGSQRKV